MTRLDAITALIAAPFVLTCLVAIVVVVAYVAQRERSARVRRNPYMAPWDRAERRPGEVIDWTRMHHGICPKCGEDKFIGHGPLCVDCIGGAA